MGQAASSGTKTLPTTNDVRALLFGGRLATLTTPKSGAVSTLVFDGTIQQLQGELALTYKVTKELTQRPPTLVRRRKQLAMDDDAEELLVVAATCSLGDAKLKVLEDEPMCACIDVFDDDVRVHFVSPTNPELGGVVLIATRDEKGVISLRGGDEYWWDGYPPIIHARGKGAASKAPPRPAFAGSFFEKDVAVRGLQGGA